MAIEIEYKRDCCTWWYDLVKICIFLPIWDPVSGVLISWLSYAEGLGQVLWGRPEFLYEFQMAYGLLPPFAQEGNGMVQFGNSIA